MNGADGVTLTAGFAILGAYLLAGVVTAWAHRSTEGRRNVALIEAGVVLACSGIALIVIDAVAPGSTDFRNASAVGFLSSKVLTIWEAVALWAGVAAVVGTINPPLDRFRARSSGLPGAAALLAVHDPILLLLAVGTWSTSAQLLPSQRARVPLMVAVAATAEWLLSMTSMRPLWGLVHGPESTLFVVVLGGVLIARWSHLGEGAEPTSAGQ